MDLAVGVIIGAAFGKIVDSVVNDLIMPIIGRVTGGLDFSNYFIALKDIPAGTPVTLDALKKAGVPVFAYGNFITIVLYFVILAWIIFIMVKWINRLKKRGPAGTGAGAARGREAAARDPGRAEEMTARRRRHSGARRDPVRRQTSPRMLAENRFAAMSCDFRA